MSSTRTCSDRSSGSLQIDKNVPGFFRDGAASNDVNGYVEARSAVVGIPVLVSPSVDDVGMPIATPVVLIGMPIGTPVEVLSPV